MHRLQQAAREIVLMQYTVSVQRANPIHQRIDAPMIEPTDDHGHGISHQRMKEAGQLPGTQMCRKYEDSAALRTGLQVVL